MDYVEFVVDKDVEIILDNKHYLLERGDKILLEAAILSALGAGAKAAGKTVASGAKAVGKVAKDAAVATGKATKEVGKKAIEVGKQVGQEILDQLNEVGKAVFEKIKNMDLNQLQNFAKKIQESSGIEFEGNAKNPKEIQQFIIKIYNQAGEAQGKSGENQAQTVIQLMEKYPQLPSRILKSLGLNN